MYNLFFSKFLKDCWELFFEDTNTCDVFRVRCQPWVVAINIYQLIIASPDKYDSAVSTYRSCHFGQSLFAYIKYIGPQIPMSENVAKYVIAYHRWNESDPEKWLSAINCTAVRVILSSSRVHFILYWALNSNRLCRMSI